MTKWSPCRAKDGGNIDIYYQSTCAWTGYVNACVLRLFPPMGHTHNAHKHQKSPQIYSLFSNMFRFRNGDKRSD